MPSISCLVVDRRRSINNNSTRSWFIHVYDFVISYSSQENLVSDLLTTSLQSIGGHAGRPGLRVFVVRDGELRALIETT